MERKVCKCGDGEVLSADGTCHKCGHPISNESSLAQRAKVMDKQERASQERADEYRKDPHNLDDGHAYLPPVGGAARPR